MFFAADHAADYEISFRRLLQAINSVVPDRLSKQAHLSHDGLNFRLSRELPSAVDCYTPDGRLPAH